LANFLYKIKLSFFFLFLSLGLIAPAEGQLTGQSSTDQPSRNELGREAASTSTKNILTVSLIPERPISARSLAHLYESMRKEPELDVIDIVIYARNLALIVSLDTDPSGINKALEETNWSLERLIYVCAKVGVGLSQLVYPENPRLINRPDFVDPTAAEEALIKENLTYLTQSYELLSAKPNDKTRRPPKEPSAPSSR
jgi:hypothetical protein